jgi:hypothetical protein
MHFVSSSAESVSFNGSSVSARAYAKARNSVGNGMNSAFGVDWPKLGNDIPWRVSKPSMHLSRSATHKMSAQQASADAFASVNNLTNPRTSSRRLAASIICGGSFSEEPFAIKPPQLAAHLRGN